MTTACPSRKMPSLPLGVIKMYHPMQQLNSVGSKGSPDSVSQKSARDLPAALLRLGWRKIWSRKERRPYFYNKITSESMWDLPKISTTATNKRKIEESSGDMETKLENIDTKKCKTDPYTEVKVVPNSDTCNEVHEDMGKLNVDDEVEGDSKELNNTKCTEMKNDTCKVELMEIDIKVKGAMIEVVKTKVIKSLNSICPLVYLKHEDEHVCVMNPKEDIMFCHVGLLEKYHMAYRMVKKDALMKKEHSDSMLSDFREAMLQRGLPIEKAEQYCSINKFYVMISHSETYSKVFEQLWAKLLTMQI